MKNALYILLCLLPVAGVAQQNHVINGSFEDKISCPKFQPNLRSLSSSCYAWYEYAFSPDYFHPCAINVAWNVPNTSYGYQMPLHGDAYTGLHAGTNSVTGEMIAQSIVPLAIGGSYEVSMSVTLADNSIYASNRLGVAFFIDGDTLLGSRDTNFRKPQISYANYGIIKDTQNWVRLIDTFIADSVYSRILLGGFYDSNSLKIDTFSYGRVSNDYYYIDSVVVKLVDSFTFYFDGDEFCIGDTVGISYYIMNKKEANNVLSIELSDASGSFASAITLDTIHTDTSGRATIVILTYISTSGNYRLRMIASDFADTTHESRSISIATKIKSLTANSNSPLCFYDTLSLNAATATQNVNYTWLGPNNFISDQQSPTIPDVIGTNSGDYIVRANIYGCVAVDTVAVYVKPLPAQFSATNNSPFCAGAILNLTGASTTTGVTYSWTGPNSFSSTTQNPAINNATTAHNGDYILTATLNGCSTKDTTTVAIKPNPNSVTLSSNSAICAGSTLQLNSTASSSGVTYAWTGPNSFTASTQNSSITNAMVNRTGWYKMVVDLNGCTYEDSLYATVHPIPNSPTLSYNNPICLGETLNLTASTVAGATYSWAGVNSFTSSNQNPSKSNMQYGDTGIYKATVSVNGCVSPADSVRVHLNANPFVVILSNPTDSICQGDPVLFTALANNHGGTPTYQWYVNSQPMGSGATYNTTGLNDKDIIKCVMVENTKCSVPYTDESNDIYMTVLPWLPPSVTITADKSQPLEKDEYITFTAHPVDAGANPEYQWKRNGNNISGATGGTWSANTLSDNDSISVEVISKYKCPQPPTASSNGIVVRVLAGVDDLVQKHKLSLFPNPNRGTFTVKGNLTTAANIDVVNAMGQVVYSTTTQANSNGINQEISLPEVASGIYLLRLHTDMEVAVLRFTVQ